ncbi:hypothetical protein ACFO5T_13980 [Dokdonia genika]|uniref:Uncharacterized protein n=1 Tax=Dokdonia genika TaxID=308113 RepID=A0ABV9LCV9_9FLAO
MITKEYFILERNETYSKVETEFIEKIISDGFTNGNIRVPPVKALVPIFKKYKRSCKNKLSILLSFEENLFHIVEMKKLDYLINNQLKEYLEINVNENIDCLSFVKGLIYIEFNTKYNKIDYEMKSTSENCTEWVLHETMHTNSR